MNNLLLKRIGIIFLIVVILILGVSVINTFIERQSQTATSKALFNDLKLDQIESLEYILPDNNLKFQKKDGNWYINNFIASSRIVEITLSKLLEVQKNYIVSNDSNTYNIYEVNNEKNKLNLQTKQGDFSLYIGKSSFNNGSFVRFSTESTTIGTNISINSILDNDVSFFRDKTITSLDPSLITSIKINENTYTKINNLWNKNSIPISSEIINPLVALVSNIEGIAIASTDDIEGIKATSPNLEILISTQTETYRIAILNYKENVYIISDSKDDFFIITSSLQQQITQFDSMII